MFKRYTMLFLALTLAAPFITMANKKTSGMDKAMAERSKKILATPYEKNRLELIKPVKMGELLLRPTFNACGFYYGTDKVDNPVLQFRKAGESKWQDAFTPVHFFEDQNTKSGLVMNEYRGSIVKLDENTVYEVRFCDGSNVLKSGKFTTWKSNVPVAKTVYIDNLDKQYVISAKGTPEGWIRYTTEKGKVLVNKSNKTPIVVRGAAYVLLDDMVIVGGPSRDVISIEKSKAVRVRNCEITDWGRTGIQRFDRKGQFFETLKKNGKPYESKYSINFDGAISIRPGSSEVVVERCYIHDPLAHANSWFYSHPAGPEAIMCYKPDHSIVIRYNDFIGSDIHRFNDAVESSGNFHSNGGINRDADVYGNFMIYCNDDNIELDGGQQNVRCFWNRFEAALCGVSIQGCMTSPVYLFENIFFSMCEEFGGSGQTIKTGGGKHGINAHAFIFNNTLVGKGSGITMMNTLKSVVKNNVFSDGQNICQAARSPISEYESNSVANAGKHGFGEGREEFTTTFTDAKKGIYTPVDSAEAVKIANFLPNGGVRGAYQKSNALDLPYRPVPFHLDRNSIVDVTVKNGKANPASVKITCTVGGKNFKSAYSIRKNRVFDWFEVTPAKGVLKSGDKITFTVKFIPEKMNQRHDYRGAFLLRTADGYSRGVSIYASTDFVQPFKLEKAGETAIYIDAFKGKAYTAKNNKANTITVKEDALGKDGKVAVVSPRKVYEYKVNVPKAGRYYFMIHGYGKSRPRLMVSVDKDKFESSRQQTFGYMSWTMLTPGRGFGNMCRHYDLKHGVHTLRIKGDRSSFKFDGLVLTDSPASFEPK